MIISIILSFVVAWFFAIGVVKYGFQVYFSMLDDRERKAAEAKKNSEL